MGVSFLDSLDAILISSEDVPLVLLTAVLEDVLLVVLTAGLVAVADASSSFLLLSGMSFRVSSFWGFKNGPSDLNKKLKANSKDQTLSPLFKSHQYSIMV